MKFTVVILKPLICILIVLISLFVFQSCNKSPKQGKILFSLTDDLGDTVSFQKFPEKIISLAPNITETLFAIGADSLIAGVTDYCDYPPEAKNKTSTGSYFAPDLEKIASLDPDVVLMNVESRNQTTYQALKKLNMKLFVSNAKNFDGIIKMFGDLGKISNRESASGKLSDSLIKIRDNYIRSDTAKKKLKALIIISIKPFMTTNAKTFISEIVNMAGMENLYKDEVIDYPLMGLDDLTLRNPEIIIMPADTTAHEKNSLQVGMIKKMLSINVAARTGRIIIVDDDIMFRPGPRIMEAVRIIKDKVNNLNIGNQ
ncbi:MAG: Vitamin B12-binding protein [Ignavibacteria bacterium]|nr:Vitamin B12-binding protein [Ignavibacteria bacterium]